VTFHFINLSQSKSYFLITSTHYTRKFVFKHPRFLYEGTEFHTRYKQTGL